MAVARVLIIDDDDLVRLTLREILENGGHAVTEASDGFESIVLLEKGLRPDILFCDIEMPGMGGVEFMRRLSEMDIDCSVVVMSGLDPLTVDVAAGMAEYRGLRVLGHIHKPFENDDILAYVEKAMAGG
jgi:CheY-like chemotaxis protein